MKCRWVFFHAWGKWESMGEEDGRDGRRDHWVFERACVKCGKVQSMTRHYMIFGGRFTQP